jgi:hypothetical protein
MAIKLGASLASCQVIQVRHGQVLFLSGVLHFSVNPSLLVTSVSLHALATRAASATIYALSFCLSRKSAQGTRFQSKPACSARGIGIVSEGHLLVQLPPSEQYKLASTCRKHKAPKLIDLRNGSNVCSQQQHTAALRSI